MAHFFESLGHRSLQLSQSKIQKQFNFEFHTISNFECEIANESMVLVRGSCHLDRSSIVEIGVE